MDTPPGEALASLFGIALNFTGFVHTGKCSLAEQLPDDPESTSFALAQDLVCRYLFGFIWDETTETPWKGSGIFQHMTIRSVWNKGTCRGRIHGSPMTRRPQHRDQAVALPVGTSHIASSGTDLALDQATSCKFTHWEQGR